jgi:TPR repeat protein
MVVVDRLIGLASPRAALRRSMRLREKGRVAEAFRLLSVAAKAGIADAEYRVARCYLEGARPRMGALKRRCC